jgi:hypothetical protein
LSFSFDPALSPLNELDLLHADSQYALRQNYVRVGDSHRRHGVVIHHTIAPTGGEADFVICVGLVIYDLLFMIQFFL